MTIIEAVNSGKWFRRNGSSQWAKIMEEREDIVGATFPGFIVDAEWDLDRDPLIPKLPFVRFVQLKGEDILADDWEVKDEP